MTLEDIVQKYNMQPHPEGGFYVETYRSDLKTQEKSIATVIYFLLPSGKKSTWHRISSDEFWFYHAGSAIEVHTIENEKYHSVRVGPAIVNGEEPQYKVNAGAIFGASVVEQDSFSFVSCMVAPGFEFSDFELFSQDQMDAFFPHLKTEIALLC